jgi:hypothetical protein
MDVLSFYGFSNVKILFIIRITLYFIVQIGPKYYIRNVCAHT